MSRAEKLGRALDSIVGILSPEAYMRRMKARVSSQAMNRFYDGATKGRRGDGWRPVNQGYRESQADIKLLRDRARDFERNNGYYKKAIGGIVGNTIGTGIVLQYKSEKQKKRAERANKFWKDWNESKHFDYDGVHNGPGLQDLIFRTMVRDGEVFLRRRFRFDYYDPNGRNPIQVQLLEAEFIDTSKDTPAGVLSNVNRIISGIEFDPSGRRVAYHVFNNHPSSGYAQQSFRVDASEIIHVFKQERPGQIRGIPWGTSIYLNLKDLDGYEDAELMRRKIAACFAGFITEAEADEPLIVNGQQAAVPEIPLIDRLEPGILEVLPNGKQITFATPPNVTGYAEYATSLLHKIAAGFEIPYSVLTGDYSQVNFSSGRMGWLEFQRVIDSYRWNLFVPRVMEEIRGWFELGMYLMGNSFEDVDHEWTAPRREMIDPMKEITALTMQVKAGLISMPEAIKESGYDPKTTLEEIENWNKELDSKKITLDSDPRKDPKRMLAEVTAQNVANKNENSNTKAKSPGE